MTRVGQYVTATIPALVMLGFFVWFANWIPQTRWEPPQRQELTASMTPAQLAVSGETIVRQRGCMACHTIEPGVGVRGGGRGPNWADIAARRAQGVPGGAKGFVDYVVQALYDPGAYLVEGFANIMPAATAAPAKLTYEEVVAVINYLQSLGGTPSVKIGDIPRPSGAAEAGIPAVGGGVAADGAAIFNASGCAACHSLEPGKVLLGPPLDAANLKQTAAERSMTPEAYIMESVVKPGAFEKKGFPSGVMPQDYGTKLTAGQLQALVNHLLSSGGKE